MVRVTDTPSAASPFPAYTRQFSTYLPDTERVDSWTFSQNRALNMSSYQYDTNVHGDAYERGEHGERAQSLPLYVPDDPARPPIRTPTQFLPE